MTRRKRVAIIRQLDELLAGVLALDDSSAEALSLLPVAAGIGLEESVHLPATSLTVGRSQLLAAIASLPQQQPTAINLPGWLRTPALAGGLAAALSGGAIAYAAQGAAPDSPLYPVQQAVQAVSQSVPFLPQPTPTATPSPAPTATPATVGLPPGSSPAAQVRQRRSDGTGTASTVVSSTPIAPSRTPEGQGKRRDDESADPIPTASATAGNRAGRQDDSRPPAGPGNGRAARADFQPSSDGKGNGNGNGGIGNAGGSGSNGDGGGNGGDNQNGRSGDRTARLNRGD